MISTEAEMIAGLEAEILRFDSQHWDCGMARSPFEAGEWLIAFEELYWAALNPQHPATASEDMTQLKDYFERHGVDFSEIKAAHS